MSHALTRRGLLQAMTIAPTALTLLASDAAATVRRNVDDGSIRGKLTGAEAVVEALQKEGAEVVFGIPGAQENELWDAMKTRGLGYLLTTHEFSASGMADGYARATGKPGIISIVPGPGVTNALSGIAEALLDSVPMVCIVGDVARGSKYRPFQVHEMNQLPMLEAACKAVYEVKHVSGIPQAVRQAYAMSLAGEPGPTAVVIPYNFLIETWNYDAPPLGPLPVPWDEAAFEQTVKILADKSRRVGIYAGLGCMDHSHALTSVAEMLQAPVATSVSGKGAISEAHPLSVGWGYGPQASHVAEKTFDHVDTLLAVGVRFSEVSTGFYSNPQKPTVIHVDANACNIGRILKTDVKVHADAGLFLNKLLERGCLRHAPDTDLTARIARLKMEQLEEHATPPDKGTCVDPALLALAMRKAMPEDALLYVDVTVNEHLFAEAYRVCRPRTYFNPTDNQSMGWSIPAALGAQRAFPGRTVASVTGDGCFLMSAMEITTAARACLPVKFFVLDDCVYQFMQRLQLCAYMQTTATVLARMDYAALAKGFGVAYMEIASNAQLEQNVRAAIGYPGPLLVRVAVDNRKRKIRWVDAVRKRYIEEMSAAQKVRFAARLGSRALANGPDND